MNFLIIGAGGIAFDVAEYLTQIETSKSATSTFTDTWGIDLSLKNNGGVKTANHQNPERKIYMLQRKIRKPGASLGKTTGWIHRTSLKEKNVSMISGATYNKIDNSGLHINIRKKMRVLAVDTIIICAGQIENNTVKNSIPKQIALSNIHSIGGALCAQKLDAQKAIEDALHLAISI